MHSSAKAFSPCWFCLQWEGTLLWACSLSLWYCKYQINFHKDYFTSCYFLSWNVCFYSVTRSRLWLKRVQKKEDSSRYLRLWLHCGVWEPCWALMVSEVTSRTSDSMPGWDLSTCVLHLNTVISAGTCQEGAANCPGEYPTQTIRDLKGTSGSSDLKAD